MDTSYLCPIVAGDVGAHARHGSDLGALDGEIRSPAERLAWERAMRLQAYGMAERSLEKLQEAQRLLTFFEQIATLSDPSGAARGMMPEALASVCRLCGWQAAHIYLPENSSIGALLVPSNNWHVADGLDLSRLRQATAAMRLMKGVSLPGRVWAQANAEWIGDLRAARTGFLRRKAALASGVHAAFAIPLMIGAEVVGVLELFATQPVPRDRELLRVMAQAGAQMSRLIERGRAQDRLHDSLHDALTGLPNRANFQWRLEQLSRDRAVPFTVLFLDMDRFKLVNDSMGHAAGDMLIREVGARMAAALAGLKHPCGPALLARLGGDEFTVLLVGTDDPGHAHTVAAGLHQALLRPVHIPTGEVLITVSIGIAFGGAFGKDRDCPADGVLRDADMAMYSAKARGTGRTALFDAAMHHAAVRRLTLEGQLRDAVRRGEFVVHYQPIVRLGGGDVVGFEALVRWRQPSGALREPGEFIQVAEETGLIVKLGHWVLREACRTAQLWAQSNRGHPLTMSVNVSARQFAQPDLVEQIRLVLAETGLDPALLRLEITETATVEDAERAVAVMSALSALGIRISIDDFGTGFSSLSYLHRFPLHILKIDRSFVSRMESNRESLQIVQTLMNLARSLGMEVVAEGAETEAQVARLRAMGCDYCQGFYFARPLEAGEAVAFSRRKEARVHF
jgi:diguanylate cyclase (GGDEF)-like protein